MIAITPNTYYGNDNETYFVNDVLAIFCIQSADLVDVGDYRQVDSMPDDVRELDGELMASYDWPDYAEELEGVEPMEVANV